MNTLKLNKSLISTAILLSSALSSHSSVAGPGRQIFEPTGEQYLSTPGTRAMGMAGAYVAFASDSSAIWYNAAGLTATEGFSDLTIEYGDFVTATPSIIQTEAFFGEDEYTYEFVDSEYTTEQDLKYIAWSANGFGLAYFKPYNFRLYLNGENSSGDDLRQEFSTEYQEFKFAMSGHITDNISIGGGIDIINQSITCEYGCAGDYDFSSEDTFGYGYSLGLIGDWTFLKRSKNPLGLKVGLNYRSAAEMDDLILLDIQQDIMPTRPQSISYGVSGNVPFAIGSIPFSLSVSIHQESIAHNRLAIPYYDTILENGEEVHDYFYGSTAPEEDKTAFGLELQTILNPDVDLYFRLGMSDTTATNANYVSSETALFEDDILTDRPFIQHYGSDTSAMTFGIGVRLYGWIIDLASENRTIDDMTPDDSLRDDEGNALYTPFSQDLNMTSLSVSYTF